MLSCDRRAVETMLGLSNCVATWSLRFFGWLETVLARRPNEPKMGERTVAQEALFHRISEERHVLADDLLGSIAEFLNLLGTLSIVWSTVRRSLSGMASGGRVDGRRQGSRGTPHCLPMGNQARSLSASAAVLPGDRDRDDGRHRHGARSRSHDVYSSSSR